MKKIKKKVLKSVIESCNNHIKKNGFRSRTIKDLKKEIEKY